MTWLINAPLSRTTFSFGDLSRSYLDSDSCFDELYMAHSTEQLDFSFTRFGSHKLKVQAFIIFFLSLSLSFRSYFIGHDFNMMKWTFINVEPSKLMLRSIFLSLRNSCSCTTRWKVAKRCYDDLIKAYYEGLTVLIKDLGSYPMAFFIHNVSTRKPTKRWKAKVSLVKCFNNLKLLIKLWCYCRVKWKQPHNSVSV